MQTSKTTLALFIVMIAFLYGDQNLMAPSLTAIGTEFGFTRAEIDEKLGAEVNLLFWMLGGVVTLFIGYVSDRSDVTAKISRKWMLVSVALFGQLACLGSGLAQNYEQLALARALTGIGIGGSFPLLYSLLADMFDKSKRAAANGFVGLAIGVGVAMGQLLAGMLVADHGWRLPFTIVGLGGIATTILFAILGKEPKRGASEEALQNLSPNAVQADADINYHATLQLQDVPKLLKVPTNFLVFLQGIPGNIPWGVFFVYLNDFYSHDKGFSVEQATLLVMGAGGASILGAFSGGLIGQKAFNKNPRYLPLVCAVATLCAVPFMAVLISYPVDVSSLPAGASPSIVGPLLVGLCTGFFASITSPNLRTMLQMVNPPEHRGAAFSLYNLFDDLGRGLGASIVGMLAASLGREPAFHVANAMWIFCAVVMFISMRFFGADEKRVQDELRAKLTAQSSL